MSLFFSCKHIVIFCCLLYTTFGSITLFAQDPPTGANRNQRDTTKFHKLNVRFQQEVAKRYDLRLDSLRFYGHSAIKSARESNYEKGIIQIHLGLGSAYIDKNSIDSAHHYFSIAIKKASSLEDQYLLAKAYSGYGWTLVYENSNYEGSIQNLSIACDIARELKDSSLINQLGNRLARVQYLKGDLIKAYETCNE